MTIGTPKKFGTRLGPYTISVALLNCGVFHRVNHQRKQTRATKNEYNIPGKLDHPIETTPTMPGILHNWPIATTQPRVAMALARIALEFEPIAF